MRYASLLIISSAISSCSTVMFEDVQAKKAEIKADAIAWAARCHKEASPLAQTAKSNERYLSDYENLLKSRLQEISKILGQPDCGRRDKLFSADYPKCISEAEDNLRRKNAEKCPGLAELKSNIDKDAESEKIRFAKEKSDQVELGKKNKNKAQILRNLENAGCVGLQDFEVIQSLGKNSYEINLHCFGRDLKSGNCILFSGMITSSQEKGLLETTQASFQSAGMVNWMYVKKKGIKSMKLSDGFDASVYMFQESRDCEKIANPL